MKLMDARTYKSPSCGLAEAVYLMEWGTFWVMHRYGSVEWKEKATTPFLQGHLTFVEREWKRNKSPWTDEDESPQEKLLERPQTAKLRVPPHETLNVTL